MNKNKLFKIKNTCTCQASINDVRITTYDYEYSLFNSSFDYILCSTCEVIRLEYIPATENIRDLYPNNYGAYLGDNFVKFGSFARDVAAKYKLIRINRFY